MSQFRRDALLTRTKSLELIDAIDKWCRRTGTNYNKLVVAARVGCTTRHKVRIKGQCVSVKVAARLTATMKANPHGISRDDYRGIEKPWRREVRPEIHEVREMQIIALQRPSSETCRRCGARYGRCEHTLSAQDDAVRMVG